MSRGALGVVTLLLATTMALRSERAQAQAQPPAPWDPAAVTRYLDARMDVWWARAKSLKTGDSETKCLSCHTAVPYALVRPALRRAQGVSAQTAHEVKLLDIARQRVEHVEALQPYYDNTDAKKMESRGVEAVLNAFLLTQADALRQGSEPSATTRAAVAHLWAVQRADGAWDWLNFGLEPYEAPDAVFHGATLAALAVGSSAGAAASRDEAGRAGLARLRGYLRAGLSAQRLFNRTWALLASSRFEGILTTSERDALVREIESRQRPDGGWSLADLGTWRWNRTEAPFAAPGVTEGPLLAASDGYATGLVVHALREAGVAVHQPAIVKGQAWLRTHQVAEETGNQAWAPWRAHSLNFDREHGGDKGESWRRMFMSDLATAFGALALL